jgi:arylsulfatase A-like enzyme
MAKANVLLICVDHWPGRLLGCLGHPTILTPTLDQMARNGVLFTNAYSTTPTCVPARRELFTGTFSRTHGDRVFSETLAMPKLPTIAHLFRQAGYQAFAVGKMHVYPQRDRVSFDDVILNEEGRHQFGLRADDYELFLAEQGYAGQEFTHGLCNNDYLTRTWHLPEYCHPTNWTVREMCKVIKRRDPTRPALWYLSFNHPHPPLAPLREYMEIYRGIEPDMPFMGEWAKDFSRVPYALNSRRDEPGKFNENAIRMARRAFYALCTHIDHQLRLVIGLLREEKLLDETVIVFTSDHGDMLGNHGLWAKGVFYEESAKIPLILIPTADDSRVGHHRVDNRLAALADIMPTLLDLCGIPIAEAAEGLSLAGDRRRPYLYGEHYEGERATRMVHDGRHKLIYYAVGNHLQLFDLEADRDERHDLADDPSYAQVRKRLTQILVEKLYGSDREWLRGEELVGLPDREWKPQPNRGLSGQRGWRFM